MLQNTLLYFPIKANGRVSHWKFKYGGGKSEEQNKLVNIIESGAKKGSGLITIGDRGVRVQ